MTLDCLALCNAGCITCLWCLILSFCSFPSYFNRYGDADSQCSFKPPRKRPRSKKCRQQQPEDAQQKCSRRASAKQQQQQPDRSCYCAERPPSCKYKENQPANGQRSGRCRTSGGSSYPKVKRKHSAESAEILFGPEHNNNNHRVFNRRATSSQRSRDKSCAPEHLPPTSHRHRHTPDYEKSSKYRPSLEYLDSCCKYRDYLPEQHYYKYSDRDRRPCVQVFGPRYVRTDYEECRNLRDRPGREYLKRADREWRRMREARKAQKSVSAHMSLLTDHLGYLCSQPSVDRAARRRKRSRSRRRRAHTDCDDSKNSETRRAERRRRAKSGKRLDDSWGVQKNKKTNTKSSADQKSSKRSAGGDSCCPLTALNSRAEFFRRREKMRAMRL